MIQSVAIVGSGYMGGGIAQVLALAGARVSLADVSAEVAIANRDRLIAEARAFAVDGLMPTDAADVIADAVSAAASIEEAVADVDFVEEAVPERLDLKHETLARISQACRADAVIGSNTSTIAIGALAEAVERPERFLGVHFSNPAPFIPGVELIAHAGTTDAAVAAVDELLTAAGKRGVRVADVTGFVLNRLQYALFDEAARLVDEGVATPEAVDTIVRTTFGYRLPFFGPFAVADMAGLDVYDFCYRSLGAAYPDRFATPPALAEHLERGELGVKTGRGFLAMDAELLPELVAYRNRAYAAMAKLLDELGPAPTRY
jgi:3-hydroxybutyryl-CoA dehydrogenase